MQKKSMAIILIACLLLIPVLSFAPSVGNVFLGAMWLANDTDRNNNFYMGLGGLMSGSGYAALAGIAGASLAASTGIGIGVGL